MPVTTFMAIANWLTSPSKGSAWEQKNQSSIQILRVPEEMDYTTDKAKLLLQHSRDIPPSRMRKTATPFSALLAGKRSLSKGRM